MISNKALDKFKRIYETEFGEKLPDHEAMEKATKFLNLMRVIMRPIPTENNNLSSQANQKGGSS